MVNNFSKVIQRKKGGNQAVILTPKWQKIALSSAALYVLVVWSFSNGFNKIISNLGPFQIVLEAVTNFLLITLSGFVLILQIWFPELLVTLGLLASVLFWYFYPSLFLHLRKEKPVLAYLTLVIPIMFNWLCAIFAYFGIVSYTAY